tara:strand:+ start:170 stop:1924 length:1755 start_codon:yes stop_codon:yes gene_type:complete
MMPFTGGIDKQLEMEMLKGPQQLQREMQTLGPDTIRMIALKRFADQEKANAMQANLQAQPPMETVADQLEQTVRGIASMRRGTSPAVQEVARRVGGVNQQKAIQAQKNMQRVAQGPTRPVMAAEGGLMSRPVNNIGDRYFQGGGIVAFQAGSPGKNITEDQIENVMARFGLSREDAIERLLKRPATPAERAKAMQRALALRSGDMDGAGVLKSPEQEMEDPTGSLDIASILTDDTDDKVTPLASAPTGAPPAPTTASTATTTGAAAAPAATPAAGIASVSPTLAPTPAKSGLAALTETLKERTEKSPEEAARLRREEAQEALGYTEEEQAQLDAMKEEAKGLETRLLDPKMNRFRAIREALAAGANTGSLGGTGAAISSAVSAGQDRVTNLERELTKERREQEREDIEKSREIRALAYGEGREEAQLTRAEADSALQGLFNAARDENKVAAQTALTNASNQTKVDIANMEADISREGNRLRAEANNLAREDKTMLGIARQIDNLIGTEVRIRADIAANYAMEIQVARQAYLNAKTDKEAEIMKKRLDKVSKDMQNEIDAAAKNVRSKLEQYESMLTKGISVTKI